MSCRSSNELHIDHNFHLSSNPYSNRFIDILSTLREMNKYVSFLMTGLLSSTSSTTSQTQPFQPINRCRAESCTMTLRNSCFTVILLTDLKQEVHQGPSHHQPSTCRGANIHARICYLSLARPDSDLFPQQKCALHIHGYTERIDPQATYSSPSIFGVLMAVGNVEKRPTSSIVLQPGVKDMLLADCKDFMSSEEWYDYIFLFVTVFFERSFNLGMQSEVCADVVPHRCSTEPVTGIPFRRGYLLYGVPGRYEISCLWNSPQLTRSIVGRLHSFTLWLVNWG